MTFISKLYSPPPLDLELEERCYERAKREVRHLIIKNSHSVHNKTPWKYPVDNFSNDCINRIKDFFSKEGYEIKLVKKSVETKKVIVKDNQPVYKTESIIYYCWLEIMIAKQMTEEKPKVCKLNQTWCNKYHVKDASKRDFSKFL